MLNPTKIKPVEYKVLIKVNEVEDKSSGGIFLPENALEREQLAHDRGTLVDASEMAFSDWKGRKPKPGDKVIFSKYAGTMIQFQATERQRDKYRLCTDKDIGAIIEEE